MTGYVGEVRMFGGSYVPQGWVACEGDVLPVASYLDLFSVIGFTYGGNGTSLFGVPDLRGRTPLGVGDGPGLTPRSSGEVGGQERVSLTSAQMPYHRHDLRASGAEATTTDPAGNTWGVSPDGAPYAPAAGSASFAPAAVRTAGTGAAHENRSPVLGVAFGICHYADPGTDDGDTTIGEIRLWAGPTPPDNWRLCDGATLDIADNVALFSILGTTYGGDGIRDFRLPDLRGRVPVHVGGSRVAGQTGGVEQVALTTAQMPAHTHDITATSAAASSSSPVGATWAVADRPTYSSAAQVAAAPTGITGGGQAHPNMPPYLALSFIIAVAGVFPSRN